MKSTGRLKELGRRTLLLVLVVAAVCLATWAGWLKSPEHVYHDLWHQLAGLRYHPEHVVIVALDDATLKEHADEPLVCWTPHFARVLEVLRRVGARVIGLDYLFYVSIESWLRKLDLPEQHRGRSHDRPFRDQLASGRVVLAGNLVVDEEDKKRVRLPLQEYFFVLPRQLLDVGLVNFYSDPDGVIRRYIPALADDYGKEMLTFAKLLAIRGGDLDPARELKRLVKDPAFKEWSVADSEGANPAAFPRVGFVGPPDTFPRISMRRLLSPRAEIDPEIQNLKGKIVIVAYEPSAMQDLHSTPYALSFWRWQGSEMSGAEVHANIVETLLTHRYPRPAPTHLISLYLVALLVAGGVLFFRLSSWWGLAAGAFLGLGAAVFSYLLFLKYWLLPVAGVQLGLILSYVGILGLRLTGEERERARIRQIFGRYVSDAVVEKLLASGRLPDLGGEAFQVTVLFADIRDFTTISESLNPRQVVEMLNAYFSRVCEPILEEGGTVDKFMGDAVLAVFGSPVPYPDHARRALRAALAVTLRAQEFRAWMAQRFGGQGLPPFRIGIGLHTGEAVVGNIGSPKRLEFTTIGDTVNTATRLEGLTKELGWDIVASRDTILAAGPGVKTGRRQVQALRGRKEMVEVSEVLGLESK